MKLMKFFWALMFTCSVAGQVQAAVEYSNNPSPGDSYTNPLPASSDRTGFDIAGSNWYYNNIGGSGVAGINTTYARSGNGSVFFSTPPIASPGTTSGKADIEFYASATTNPAGNYSATSALGVLGELSSLSYEWYRAGSSTNSDVQHPSLRLQVVDPANTNIRGYLVFERAYNGDLLNPPNPSPLVPTDTWVADDVFAGDYRLWSTGTLPDAGVTVGSRTLSEWMNDYRSYLVTGISSGVGSGWGYFVGAVDNITFGFNDNDTTYNFEVQADGVVPEPMTIAVWSVLGLCGSAFAWRAKRRQLTA